MTPEELPRFREELHKLLSDPTSGREAFERLFAGHAFPEVDAQLRARKRRCRVRNEVLVSWPTQEENYTHRMGQWLCTETECHSAALEWCPHLNTLILRTQVWNEAGPVGLLTSARK
jgi:hypothetical protein